MLEKSSHEFQKTSYTGALVRRGTLPCSAAGAGANTHFPVCGVTSCVFL